MDDRPEWLARRSLMLGELRPDFAVSRGEYNLRD